MRLSDRAQGLARPRKRRREGGAHPRCAADLGAAALGADGRLILYPFTLLSTWVHEMGHGLTAIAVGGRFLRLDIFADASGMAHLEVVRGLGSALSSAGGLLGRRCLAPSFGCGATRSPAAVAVLAASLLLSLLLWVRTLVGLVTVGGLGVGIALLARWLPPAGRVFFAQLLGLLCVFDTVARGDYLFTEGARVGGALHPSDVAGSPSRSAART